MSLLLKLAPYKTATVGVTVVALLIGTAWKSYHLGIDHAEAAQARDERVVQIANELFTGKAAELLAAAKPRHHTIQGKTREIVREVPVYRDCSTTPDVAGLLDAARANRPAPSSGVPGAGADLASDVR